MRVFRWVGVTLLWLSLAGCSRALMSDPVAVSVEHLGPTAQAQLAAANGSATPQQQAALAKAGEVSPALALAQVGTRYSGTDPVSEAVQQLAQQLAQGLDQHRVRRLPLAVLRFYDLMQRDQSGPLGERLSDSFLYQLQQRGYNLVDYRAVSLTTSWKPDTDANNLSLLYARNRIYFVLTGTYARHPDGLVINARVLDTTTRQVLASAQTHIPDERLLGRWPGYDPLSAQQKGMIIEGRQGPGTLEDVGVNQ